MLQGDLVLQKIKEAQSGSEAAKTEIIENNLPLIKSIVRRYKNKQIEYEDLIQLGTLGLIKAINNFDLNYGVQFSTYAVPMIAGEIKRFIRDDGAIKVSRSIKAQAQTINKFIEEYRHREQREPTVDELSEEFDIEPAEVIFVLESVRYPLSIYAESEEEGLSLADKIVAKGTPEETIDKMLLRDVINKLPPREKKIIILRYFRDKTQSEIAAELNVSQVQISRLEAKILSKMRADLI
jgi:RNA polymerase sigma factor, sigma-70 family/RNA polymerase sigma-70 factor, sigma-B/F/G subfamily